MDKKKLCKRLFSGFTILALLISQSPLGSLLGTVGTASAAITGITVLSPNGGTTLRGTVPVTWTEVGDTDTVNIYYSINNFATSVLITSAIAAGTETYNWDTTSLPDGSSYKIKVRHSTDSDIYDVSDTDFTLDNTAPTNENDKYTADSSAK